MSADPQAAETMAPLLDAITESANALVTIPRAELIFVPGGAKKVLDSIRDRARAAAAKFDVSRPKDRKAIISLSMDLRHLKVAGDDSGKALKAEYQAKITPIDAERRAWRDEMDALADEIRRPVTEFEAAEETRIREHEAACNDLVWPKFTDNMEPSSAEATALIDALDHMHVTRDWREFADRAAATRANSRNALLVARMNAEGREKAEAEILRLAAEEANHARLAAHEAALEDMDAATNVVPGSSADTIRATLAAYLRRPERDWEEFAERAAADRELGIQHLQYFIAEADKSEATERAAREAEIARQAAETARVAAETAAREEATERARMVEEARLEAQYAAQQALEAVERERLRIEAEARAAEQRAADELADLARRAQEEQDRLAREARQAEERAAQAEQERVDRIKGDIAAIPESQGYGKTENSAELARRGRWLIGLRDTRDWQEFAGEARLVIEAEIQRTRQLLDAAQLRETEALNAECIANEQREQSAAAAAIEAERQRVEGERLREEALTRQREADKAHRGKVNREAAEGLVAAGLSEQAAKTAVTAIARSEVKNVRIIY
jgi:colicin import membrane protein